MIQIKDFWWPDDVGEKWRHSLKHVKSLEWSLARCARRRTAVQAGGNMGLWPRRMSEVFERVITFEPDAISHACLRRNTFDRANVQIRAEALGEAIARCSVQHRSLGSHQVTAGISVPMTTVDALGLDDVDLLQLDIEGYEWHALMGAVETIRRCRPQIQVELRGFTEKYGSSDAAVQTLLASLGYREVTRQAGNDVVFEAAP